MDICSVSGEQADIDETNYLRLAPRARDLFTVTGYRMSWHEYVHGSYAVRNRERAYSGLLSQIRSARSLLQSVDTRLVVDGHWGSFTDGSCARAPASLQQAIRGVTEGPGPTYTLASLRNRSSSV